MAWKHLHITTLDTAVTQTLPEYIGLLVVRANTTAGSITLTIPDAADCGEIWIVKAAGSTGTVSFSGTVNGASITATLNHVGDSLILRSDGTSWRVGNRTITR